ncbi:MAG: complex I NDUFA9 subunit family protein [Paracoccaceae bacterium]|nr:complex I NDUFA9 subunit family protein [Paracoccaceae bacterium]
MTAQSPLVTIIGGSGFVGRHIAQKMARRGWRVRVACRRPNEAMFVKPYGTVGQVEPVQCNIRDEASTRAVIRGADAVVNCVGLLFESGRNTFDACMADGAGRVARIAAEEGVGQLVHISAIGADAESPAEYARCKAQGELAVAEVFPGAVILRPSVVFGQDDGFFNRFATMARLIPLVLPLVGGETRFQPVWAEDVAEAAARGCEGKAAAGIYELGGPTVMTLREAVAMMLKVTRRKRLIIDTPFFFARIQAWFLQMLPNPLLTVDQVKLLQRDNVVSEGARTLADLGIEPTAPEGLVESYLYAYRPQGQYTQLTENGGEA